MEKRDGIDVARREFLGQCGLMVLLAGGAATLLQACDTSEVNAPTGSGSVEIGVGSLDADGKALISDENGPDAMKILVIRKDATTYLAMTTKCTHQGCQVNPPQNGSITCPCHGSRYTLEGAVINGPAPSPLHRYATTYDATRSILTVSW
jgi:thiosulfate dehydrogenase [quinone] large subunit